LIILIKNQIIYLSLTSFTFGSYGEFMEELLWSYGDESDADGNTSGFAELKVGKVSSL
jgi:hypothetical protein